MSSTVATRISGGRVGARLYARKKGDYFEGARRDYVAAVPVDSEARVLEVGCGAGATGALMLDRHRCIEYCGIELDPDAAAVARHRLTAVLQGNVEEMSLPWGDEHFDVLILSEVLEHLVDPWRTVHRLAHLLCPGGLVFASVPNVSHHSVVRGLLRGDWRLADCGIMDRTHLRWFTPATFRDLFEDAGIAVDTISALAPLSRKARFVNALTLRRFAHLFVAQINIHGHKI